MPAPRGRARHNRSSHSRLHECLGAAGVAWAAVWLRRGCIARQCEHEFVLHLRIVWKLSAKPSRISKEDAQNLTS
jgi:hypothetical protein